MEKFRSFLRRKDIVISARRYGIDALGAMAQGLFCSLLIGTIISTCGTQFHLPFLNTIGDFASKMSGPAMAIAIGYALHCPPLVLFSLDHGWQRGQRPGRRGRPARRADHRHRRG